MTGRADIHPANERDVPKMGPVRTAEAAAKWANADVSGAYDRLCHARDDPARASVVADYAAIHRHKEAMRDEAYEALDRARAAHPRPPDDCTCITCRRVYQGACW